MHTIWSNKTWTSRSPARTSCLIAVRTRPTSSPSLPALTDYHGHSDHLDHHYHLDHHQVTFPCRVRNQHNPWASGPTLLEFSPSPFSSVFRINHFISYNVSIKPTWFFYLNISIIGVVIWGHPTQNVPLWTSSCQSGILASLFKSTISTTEYLPSSLSWSHYLHIAQCLDAICKQESQDLSMKCGRVRKFYALRYVLKQTKPIRRLSQ